MRDSHKMMYMKIFCISQNARQPVLLLLIIGISSLGEHLFIIKWISFHLIPAPCILHLWCTWICGSWKGYIQTVRMIDLILLNYICNDPVLIMIFTFYILYSFGILGPCHRGWTVPPGVGQLLETVNPHQWAHPWHAKLSTQVHTAPTSFYQVLAVRDTISLP